MEAECQQDAFFEDARRDVGVADGAEEGRVQGAKFVADGVGQYLACPLVALAADVVLDHVVVDVVFSATVASTFMGLIGHFRPGTVSGYRSDLVHRFPLRLGVRTASIIAVWLSPRKEILCIGCTLRSGDRGKIVGT